MYSVIVESPEGTYVHGEYASISSASNDMLNIAPLDRTLITCYLTEKKGAIIAIQYEDVILSVVKKYDEYKYRMYTLSIEDRSKSLTIEGTKNDIINWFTKWYRQTVTDVEDVSDEQLNIFIDDKHTSKFKDNAVKQILHEYDCPSGKEYPPPIMLWNF